MPSGNTPTTGGISPAATRASSRSGTVGAKVETLSHPRALPVNPWRKVTAGRAAAPPGGTYTMTVRRVRSPSVFPASAADSTSSSTSVPFIPHLRH
jgi:hypothetical protein